MSNIKQEIVPVPITFGQSLKSNLDIIGRMMRSDRDWFHAIVGDEGSGKSNLGIQICSYVDPTFDVDRIVFTADELQMAVYKSEKYQAILMDEGIETLFARKTMTASSINLVQMLAQIRYKNLFFCLNIPDWFLLESYTRGHRVKSLCRIINRTEIEGKYAFFGRRRIKIIKRDETKKVTEYPEPAFFESFRPIEDSSLWQKYVRKREVYHSTNRNAKVWKERLDKTKLMKKSFNLMDIATIFGVSKGSVQGWVYHLHLIPKREMFMDIFGQRRVTEKGYKKLQKNLHKYKQSIKHGRPKMKR